MRDTPVPSDQQVETFARYYQQYYGHQLPADEARRKFEEFLGWLDAARAARRKTAPERAGVLDTPTSQTKCGKVGHGGVTP